MTYTPEQKRAAYNRWAAANPDKVREKNRVQHLRRWKDPEHRAKIKVYDRERKRERYHTDPVYRAKVIARNKAYREGLQDPKKKRKPTGPAVLKQCEDCGKMVLRGICTQSGDCL